jgi:transposase
MGTGTPRRRHSSEFKAQVALEAAKGQKTLNEVANQFGVHPVEIAQWKRQLLDGGPALFAGNPSSATKPHAVRRLIQVPRPLAAVFLVVCGNLALAGCGAVTRPSTHLIPPATATPVVLYQADFSQELANWNPSPGWTIVNGALQSDGGDKRSVTIPYQPASHDYAVEFRLRVVSVPVDGGYFDLSADPTPTADGYMASINMLFAPGPRPGGAHPAASVYIAPLDHQNLSAQQVIDFEPQSDARLYRVDIHGPTVVFSVDGHVVSRASSTNTLLLSSGPLRLACVSVIISVSAVRVLSA